MTGDAPDDRLRVVSFNIRTGLAVEHRPARSWCRRRTAVWAVLADLAPDVIALQEVHGFQRRGLLSGATGYTVAAARPRGRWWGESCPLVVRRERFRVLSEEVSWFTDRGLDPHAAGARMAGARHPRIAARVRLLDRRTGAELVVVNTHLATEAEPRRRALGQLAASLGGADDTLVIGDFNAAPDAPELQVLDAAGLTRVAVHGATYHRYSGTAVGEPIDHVFLGAAWRVLGADVDRSRPAGGLASDHWPVVADLVRRLP